MYQGNRGQVLVDGVLDCLAHQAFGALLRHRLDADPAHIGEADLGSAHLLDDEIHHLFGLGRAGLVLHSGVDIFRVFAKDHHVTRTRVLHRRGHALKPAHRPQAGIEVQFLAQGDVQRTEPTPHRGRQRALDSNDILLDRRQGFLGEPVAIVKLSGLLAGVYFHPGYFFRALVSLLDGGVDHLDHDRADVDANAVAFDVGNDRIVRDVQAEIFIDGDFVTFTGNLNMLVAHNILHCCCRILEIGAVTAGCGQRWQSGA